VGRFQPPARLRHPVLRIRALPADAPGRQFSAATTILWEFAEYITFVRNSPELQTAYPDTLGDLMRGLGGSVIAGVLIGRVLWPRRNPGHPAEMASQETVVTGAA
jgi:hypothetical protein